MHPALLPSKVRNNPKRRAECVVFDSLYEFLNDEKFHVFYSKEWLNRQFNDPEQEDGECDFIVAHPEMGILFIEVKGGEIRRESNNTWYSGNYKIKDPVKQARTSKHFIRQALRERWGSSMPFIKMVHCVLFPNSSNRSRYLGEGYPLEIFGFLEDMDDAIARKIYRFYSFEAYNDSKINGELGETGIKHLNEMFSKSLDFSTRLKNRIFEQSLLIEKKTNEQKRILSILQNTSNAIIEGPAGSGKTMLAVELAVEQARFNPNHRILFICFNSPLRKFILNLIGQNNPNIYVHTPASLTKYLADKANINYLGAFNPRIDWNMLGSIFVDSVDIVGPLFDTLIIDEGQDISKQWWEYLQFSVNDPAHKKWVFRDNNQKIYSLESAEYKELGEPFLLNEILRNTEEIGFAASNFYMGNQCSQKGPRGDPIQWVCSDNKEKELIKIVRRLISYEGVKPNQIAILSMRGFENSSLYGLNKLGEYFVVQAEEQSEKAITVDSVYRFKGLEKEVVILIDFEENSLNEELLYVGISRAKSYLIFLTASETDKNDLQDALSSQR